MPVPTFVLDELAALCTDKGSDALVFTGRDRGGHLPRPKSAGGWFAAAVMRSGIQPITPHDLRTPVRLSRSARASMFLRYSGMLGHTSAKVTLDTYSDLFDDDLDAVAVTLHSRYSDSSVGKVWAQGERTGL